MSLNLVQLSILKQWLTHPIFRCGEGVKELVSLNFWRVQLIFGVNMPPKLSKCGRRGRSDVLLWLPSMTIAIEVQ